MLSELIEEAEKEFAKDYEGSEDKEKLTNAYKQGMIKAIALIMEQSLYGPVSFDIINNQTE